MLFKILREGPGRAVVAAFSGRAAENIFDLEQFSPGTGTRSLERCACVITGCT